MPLAFVHPSYTHTRPVSGAPAWTVAVPCCVRRAGSVCNSEQVEVLGKVVSFLIFNILPWVLGFCGAIVDRRRERTRMKATTSRDLLCHAWCGTVERKPHIMDVGKYSEQRVYSTSRFSRNRMENFHYRALLN